MLNVECSISDLSENSALFIHHSPFAAPAALLSYHADFFRGNGGSE
jgi:hypothetical protein